MLIVDKEMPKNCVDCFMRMECGVYKDWLRNNRVYVPKRKEHLKECMIKGETANESVV